MRRAAAAIAIAALLDARGARAGDDFVKVIPPGNEQLVGEMLGGALPGKCALGGASIERTRIVATYSCAGKTSKLALHHPADPAASAPAAKTAEFAIVAQGDPPRALIDAIAARVTEKERGWRWVSSEPPGRSSAPSAPGAPATPGRALPPAPEAAAPPPPHRLFVSPSSFGGAALAIAVVSTAVWMARRQRASSG